MGHRLAHSLAASGETKPRGVRTGTQTIAGKAQLMTVNIPAMPAGANVTIARTFCRTAWPFSAAVSTARMKRSASRLVLKYSLTLMPRVCRLMATVCMVVLP